MREWGSRGRKEKEGGRKKVKLGRGGKDKGRVKGRGKSEDKGKNEEGSGGRKEGVWEKGGQM